MIIMRTFRHLLGEVMMWLLFSALLALKLSRTMMKEVNPELEDGSDGDLRYHMSRLLIQ